MVSKRLGCLSSTCEAEGKFAGYSAILGVLGLIL